MILSDSSLITGLLGTLLAISSCTPPPHESGVVPNKQEVQEPTQTLGPTFGNSSDYLLVDVQGLPRLRQYKDLAHDNKKDEEVNQIDGVTYLNGAPVAIDLSGIGKNEAGKLLHDHVAYINTLIFNDVNDCTADVILVIDKLKSPDIGMVFRNTDITEDLIFKCLSSIERKSLHLAFSQASDSGLPLLKRIGVIRGLYLQNSSITDKSIETVCRLHRLKYLDISGTAVTEEAVDSISCHSSLELLDESKEEVVDKEIKTR